MVQEEHPVLAVSTLIIHKPTINHYDRSFSELKKYDNGAGLVGRGWCRGMTV